MNAVRLHAEKLVYADGAIREEVIWRVPAPVPPSQHGYKYRLVYVVQGRRVIGFDNERGRATITTGMARNTPYGFRDLVTLLTEFRAMVDQERDEK